jgi:ankyrin repeat protein
MDLIGAARTGLDLDAVKRIIEEGNADVNWTPLFWAIERDRIDICRLLIEKGVDVNHKNSYGNTPLILAVIEAKVNIIFMLLISGANVHHINNFCDTALDFALRDGNYYIANILCWKGAKFSDEIDRLVFLIYSRVLPVDQLREICTKWIS